MTNILITGYYGLGNIGDEAILSGIINSLSCSIDDAKFSVITNNPDETKILHNIFPISQTFKRGMKTFIKNQIREKEIQRVFDSINDCDIFILGGGSLLHDLVIYNLPVLLSLLQIAKNKRKKTVIYGIGAGPIETRLGKLLCKNILNKVDLITVRDSKSKIALESCGVINVIQTADPAFAINIPNKNSIDGMLNNIGLVNRSDIISTTAYMNLHNAKLHYKLRAQTDLTSHRKIMANVYDDVIKQYNKNLLFLPTVKGDYNGYVEINKLISNTNRTIFVDYQYNFNYILSILSISDILIGMRLHSLILATILGVPFVPIVYDDKVKSFLELVGLEKISVDIDNIDEPNYKEILLNNFSEVWDNRTDYSNLLLKHSERLRTKAFENAKLVSNLIK